ncbi:hypothetical protein B7P43_G11230, partial [Cryptotermes secundus]
LEAYMEVDRAIWREEQQVPAPAPALSFATARLEALNTELQAAEERVAAWSQSGDGGSDESLWRVILELGIHRNEERATEHEEFISTINRQVLARNEVAVLRRRWEEATEEVKVLKSKVSYLQGLYQEEDSLLEGLFGESYGSEEEKHIELELDKVRSYRDTMAGGVLEWQEASMLVQAATELLERAVTCWKELSSQTPETRFHLSTEARNTIQEAALNIQTAQAILPGVQFPYCTTREMSALLQAVVYMFTDMQIPERYSYAGQCYRNFRERARALFKWMQDKIENSLKKDLTDVDREVSEVNKRLRRLRVSLIRHKMGDYSMERCPAPPPFGGSSLRRLTTSERCSRSGFDSRQYKASPHQADMLQGRTIHQMYFNAPGEWGPNGLWKAVTQIPGQWSQ